jgi:hypothetical protein
MESISMESTILNGNINEIIVNQQDHNSSLDIDNYYLEVTENKHEYYNDVRVECEYYNDDCDRSLVRCCEQSISKDTYKINNVSLEIQHDYLYLSPTALNRIKTDYEEKIDYDEQQDIENELELDETYLLFMTNDYDLINTNKNIQTINWNDENLDKDYKNIPTSTSYTYSDIEPIQNVNQLSSIKEQNSETQLTQKTTDQTMKVNCKEICNYLMRPIKNKFRKFIKKPNSDSPIQKVIPKKQHPSLQQPNNMIPSKLYCAGPTNNNINKKYAINHKKMESSRASSAYVNNIPHHIHHRRQQRLSVPTNLIIDNHKYISSSTIQSRPIDTRANSNNFVNCGEFVTYFI